MYTEGITIHKIWRKLHTRKS